MNLTREILALLDQFPEATIRTQTKLWWRGADEGAWVTHSLKPVEAGPGKLRTSVEVKLADGRTFADFFDDDAGISAFVGLVREHTAATP